MAQFLVFAVGEGRYALALDRVVEIAPRVRVVPLAGLAPPVMGLVRHRGAVAVAVDLRARFGVGTAGPARSSLDDHFVIARTARRLVALIVDAVLEVRAIAGEAIAPPVVVPHVHGVLQIEGGLLLLHDLDAVLSLDEERALDLAGDRAAEAELPSASTGDA